METRAAILIAGVNGVKLYKQISGCLQETEVPERFITSLMAIDLHKHPGRFAKPERTYVKIAEELGIGLDASDRRLTGLSADIALYQDSRPVAVIEAKKFDEGFRDGKILFDSQKGDACALITKLEVFLAVMVCEVKNKYLPTRKAELEHETICESTRCEWVTLSPFWRGMAIGIGVSAAARSNLAIPRANCDSLFPFVYHRLSDVSKNGIFAPCSFYISVQLRLAGVHPRRLVHRANSYL